jgi:hypothetical protein
MSYEVGQLTGAEFKHIRRGLLMTQEDMAALLGYAQAIRISEYERETNPVPIPPHIQQAVLDLYESGGRLEFAVDRVRQWTRSESEDDERQGASARLWATGHSDGD